MVSVIDLWRSGRVNLLPKPIGKTILRTTFSRYHGALPDIENPITFSDKLFVRMILAIKHGAPVMTYLSDKVRAREYVLEVAGSQYLVPLLWTGKDAHDIPFDTLPEKYIIKTNNGSGGHIVGHWGIDRESAVKKINQILNSNYYWMWGEYQYYGIKPRVIVEEHLDDGNTNGPLDFRCWCFDGKVEFIQVDNNGHSINAFYDTNWNELPFSYRDTKQSVNIPKPNNLDEILHLASLLAANIDFVRVDMYNIRGRIYFGEMTFTPVAGRLRFEPASWNKRIGDLWKMKHSGVVQPSDLASLAAAA
jgi:hypothetical protein